MLKREDEVLDHLLDQFVDFFATSTGFTSFHKVKQLGLAGETTSGRRQLERPQKVVVILVKMNAAVMHARPDPSVAQTGDQGIPVRRRIGCVHHDRIEMPRMARILLLGRGQDAGQIGESIIIKAPDLVAPLQPGLDLAQLHKTE